MYRKHGLCVVDTVREDDAVTVWSLPFPHRSDFFHGGQLKDMASFSKVTVSGFGNDETLDGAGGKFRDGHGAKMIVVSVVGDL